MSKEKAKKKTNNRIFEESLRQMAESTETLSRDTPISSSRDISSHPIPLPKEGSGTNHILEALAEQAEEMDKEKEQRRRDEWVDKHLSEYIVTRARICSCIDKKTEEQLDARRLAEAICSLIKISAADDFFEGKGSIEDYIKFAVEMEPKAQDLIKKIGKLKSKNAK